VVPEGASITLGFDGFRLFSPLDEQPGMIRCNRSVLPTSALLTVLGD
jgi:hypothetical protein